MVLQGKLIGVKVNGNFIRCQTDATLNIIINTTEDEPCKPTEEQSTNEAAWITRTVDTKDWNVSVTAKSFADAVSGFIDNSDIATLMVVGDPNVEMTFQTIRTTDYNYASIFVYEGTGILTSFTQNAPEEGQATYDLEISGNGALTFEETPITT